MNTTKEDNTIDKNDRIIHQTFTEELMKAIKSSLKKQPSSNYMKAYCVLILRTLLDNSISSDHFKDNPGLRKIVIDAVPADILAAVCFMKNKYRSNDFVYEVQDALEEIESTKVIKIAKKIKPEKLLMDYFLDISYEGYLY